MNIYDYKCPECKRKFMKIIVLQRKTNPIPVWYCEHCGFKEEINE